MRKFTIQCMSIVIGLMILSSPNFAVAQRVREYPRKLKPEDYMRAPEAMGKDSVTPIDVPSVSRKVETEGIEEYEMAVPTRIEVGVLFQDRILDPDLYKIVPGDEITVYLWGELDKPYVLSVTPEGNLIIPMVGELKVGDMSLSEAKKKINDFIVTKYKDIDVTVELTMFNQFKILISGAVRYPGMYPAFGLDRVSDIIEKAGGLILEQYKGYEGEITPEERPGEELAVRRGVLLSSASTQRTIALRRKNETIPVDLIRYKKLGDLEANPYVNLGDQIHVLPKASDVWVSGEVYVSGFYEFKEGDTVADLIAFADGLRSKARTDEAELVSFNPDGRTWTKTLINLDEALNHNPGDGKYKLKPFDRLYVRRRPEWKINRGVEIRGMVLYPGWYPIVRDETTLTEVIKMAGGMTEDAYLEEATLIRQAVTTSADPEYERLLQILVADMSNEEYEYFKVRGRERLGKFAIDFVKLFRDNDLSEDIVVRTNDLINIPQLDQTINILGEVEYPGLMKFDREKSWLDYIEEAGGLTWKAQRRKIQIIKGATGQRFKPKNVAELEPGDAIWIPEKEEVNMWEWFQDFALVLANVATVIIVVQTITN